MISQLTRFSIIIPFFFITSDYWIFSHITGTSTLLGKWVSGVGFVQEPAQCSANAHNCKRHYKYFIFLIAPAGRWTMTFIIFIWFSRIFSRIKWRRMTFSLNARYGCGVYMNVPRLRVVIFHEKWNVLPCLVTHVPPVYVVIVLQLRLFVGVRPFTIRMVLPEKNHRVKGQLIFLSGKWDTESIAWLPLGYRGIMIGTRDVDRIMF